MKKILFSLIVIVFSCAFMSAAWAANEKSYLVRNPTTSRASVEVVSPDDVIQLRDDESAELYIDRDVIHLPNGFRGTLSEAKNRQRRENDLIRRVVALLATSANQRLSDAASRNPGPPPPPPPADLRVTDISLDSLSEAGSAQCYFDMPLRIWRRDAAGSETYILAGANAVARSTFADGEAIARWPTNLPVRDGENYLALDDSPSGEFTVFKLIGLNINALEDISVAVLIENDCMRQARLFSDQVVARASSS